MARCRPCITTSILNAVQLGSLLFAIEIGEVVVQRQAFLAAAAEVRMAENTMIKDEYT